MSETNTHFRNVNENPCNMCMPMGGILALKGIEKTMVIIHGSQGCSTYMRRHISEHFNEPVDVASSSLNEKGTVYGGEENLKKGLDNLRKVYHPDFIGIFTTCLAETIGEDIERIAQEYVRERDLSQDLVVAVPTPGYGGTHTEGYFLTIRRIVAKLAKKTQKHSRINVIIPNISPADIRELKRILSLMDIGYILLPDVSDTLDAPYSRLYHKIPEGGTPLAHIRAMSGAVATVELGITVDDSLSAGKYLEEEYGVPLYRLPLPMGIENTDLFLRTLGEITGKGVPRGLELERGRLLDCMIDSHKYNFQGRCTVFGEPELVYAISTTCLENGIFPAVIATGSRNERLGALLAKSLQEGGSNYVLLNDTDFAHIREQCKIMKVNLAIGSSEGRYLTEREGIPLVRVGFPVHDQVGGQRILSLGYQGTMAFLDRITNTLLDNKHQNYRSSLYRKYFVG
ncbi:MAG: nitrogenase component 1 [Bacillota bacterium]